MPRAAISQYGHREEDWISYYSFNHSATSNSFSGFWSQIYHNILQANNLILNINKIERSG